MIGEIDKGRPDAIPLVVGENARKWCRCSPREAEARQRELLRNVDRQRIALIIGTDRSIEIAETAAEAQFLAKLTKMCPLRVEIGGCMIDAVEAPLDERVRIAPRCRRGQSPAEHVVVDVSLIKFGVELLDFVREKGCAVVVD